MPLGSLVSQSGSGQVEKGKIVTDGDLFEEKTKIRQVFVDGRLVDLEEPPAPRSAARRGAQ